MARDNHDETAVSPVRRHAQMGTLGDGREPRAQLVGPFVGAAGAANMSVWRSLMRISMLLRDSGPPDAFSISVNPNP